MAWCRVNNVKASSKLEAEDIRVKLREVYRVSPLVSKNKKCVNFFVVRKRFVFSVFYTGHVNCTKLRNFSELEEARCELSSIFPFAHVSPLKIDNISANGQLVSKINLFNFGVYLRKQGQDFHFNPQRFPGLIFKVHKGSITVFRSGKYIIVGTNTVSNLEESRTQLEDYVRRLP